MNTGHCFSLYYLSMFVNRLIIFLKNILILQEWGVRYLNRPNSYMHESPELALLSLKHRTFSNWDRSRVFLEKKKNTVCRKIVRLAWRIVAIFTSVIRWQLYYKSWQCDGLIDREFNTLRFNTMWIKTKHFWWICPKLKSLL